MMKYLLVLVAVVVVAFIGFGLAERTSPDFAVQAADKAGPEIDNPEIDMPGFLKTAQSAAEHRKTHRITEEQFILMSQLPGSVILDARSEKLFKKLHIRGAINLSFPDIAIDSLEQTIPDKNTLILIYCNNNFKGAKDPFPPKIVTASLNLSTFVSLYDYGYRNVYELGPNIDIKQAQLEFEPQAELQAITSGH
ncbi:MAG: rhodanese-like domain-containing protein [Planctomycetaceae bacterium]